MRKPSFQASTQLLTLGLSLTARGKNMAVKGEAWDLTPLVPSTKIDKLQALMEQHVKTEEDFATKYKGKVPTMDAKAVRTFLEEYQKQVRK